MTGKSGKETSTKGKTHSEEPKFVELSNDELDAVAGGVGGNDNKGDFLFSKEETKESKVEVGLKGVSGGVIKGE